MEAARNSALTNFEIKIQSNATNNPNTFNHGRRRGMYRVYY